MIMLIISFLLVLLLNLFLSAQSFDYFTNCTGSSNYTKDSSYRKNLDNLLDNLTSQASLSGFYYSSLGQAPDRVYGLYLCRGDIDIQGCSQCVYQARGSILKECPTQIWAVLWYDDCMLRFSNNSFYHKMDVALSEVAWNPQNMTTNEGRALSKVLKHTMSVLVPQVANNKVKFGTKVANITSSQSLYTLGQCTLDLSVDNCDQCLRIAVVQLPMKPGGRVLLPSCNVRFEVSQFYSNSVNASFLLPAITNSTATVMKEKHNRSHIAIAVSIPAVLAVLTFTGVCLIWTCRRKKATPPPDLEDIITVESLQFDFKTIRTATENFCTDNKLGEGGFGVVYKGRLSDGQEIAVKRLSTNSRQGLKEFKTEVLLVAKLQHKNLIITSKRHWIGKHDTRLQQE